MSDFLQPGQLFAGGRYRIERFLAKGGFGGVYIAEQIETELRVALKVLWPHVLDSADAIEKFKLEARVASRIDSEHIVKVMDAGFDDATQMFFLVMELLKGADLEHVITSSGPFPPDRLVTYFSQMASALDKAHGYTDRQGVRRPIVHRDLKPQNVFLSHRESGEPCIKILDFGIAKVLGDSTNVSQDLKGTPLYMAFEQAGGGRITPQTDIWALGLIGFFLFTGRSYWMAANVPDSTRLQLVSEILLHAIEPASQRARDIGAPVIPSPLFDAWFARCVDRDPTSRFKTAGQCATALAEVFGMPGIARGAGVDVFGPTVVSKPPGARSINTTSGSLEVSQSVPLDRKSHLLWGIPVAALLVLAVGGTIYSVSHPSSETPPLATSGSLHPGPADSVTSIPSASTRPLASGTPPVNVQPSTSASTIASTPTNHPQPIHGPKPIHSSVPVATTIPTGSGPRPPSLLPQFPSQ